MEKNTPVSTQALRNIDYKDVETLRKFINPNGRISPRRTTGISLKNQRKVATVIKRARFMGLLPYVEQ